MKNLRCRFSVYALAAFFSISTFAFVPQTRAADYTVTPASVVASSDGSTHSQLGTAGVTILPGQLVYLASDNKYKLADANGASPLYKVAGVALNGADNNQPLKVCWQDNNFNPGATIPAGAIVVASATPGGIAPTADLATGYFTTIVGVGIGNNKIHLFIFRADVAVP